VTPDRLSAAARAAARRACRSRQLQIREGVNKVRFAPSAVAGRRVENAEVARLAAGPGWPAAALVVTIITTFRRPGLLPRAVRSALGQTVRDQLVLVIDDGGGLPPLPADPRLRAVSLSANTGNCGLVRNIGMRLTSSVFVAFLDDDNEWEPCHLQVALDALTAGTAGEQPDLVYTAVDRIMPDGRLLDRLSTPFDRRLLAGRGFVDSNALVFRRFPGLRFSRITRRVGIRPRADWELVYRVTRNHRAVHVPTPTVRYLVNPESYYTDWTGVS